MAYTVTARIEAIRARRDAAGWTTADLARAMDMSRSTVSRILDGRVQPGPTFIAGIAAAFGPESVPVLFEFSRDERPRAAA